MKVVFRVDASTRMGIGHLMRCLTLAETLRERGAQLHFICREHTGNLIIQLQQRAVPVTVLPSPIITDASLGEDYAAWLGVSQSKDAEQTIKALNGEKPDWLVVDHYGLDVEWEQRIRPHVSNLIVIDDLANRNHECEVLLDQNYSVEDERRYAGLVPDNCRLLIGPRYALLKAEYALYRKTLRARDGQVKKVLVFFGGTDPQNMTGMVLEALSHTKLCHLEVSVVIGANNPHRESLEMYAREKQQIRIYGPRSHLADLMAQTDIAIGAGGATTWERMCLGLPTLVVSLAENQRPASEALAAAKLIYYAGHFSDIEIDHLEQLLQNLILSNESLSEQAAQNMLQVDGLGVFRLAEVLCPSSASEIRLRPAIHGDVFSYFHWIVDQKGNENLVNDKVNSWLLHQECYERKLVDTNTQMFILEARGLSVGQIRFNKGGDQTSLEYSLDSIVSGRDLESRLVFMGASLLKQINPIQLTVADEFINVNLFPVYLKMESADSPKTFRKNSAHSIAILSDRDTWMNDYIRHLFFELLTYGHQVMWVHDKHELQQGDFCFYLGCGQIVQPETLSQFRHNLVVHESDLPIGKGWSPLTWQILEGKNRIPATLIEANENVDSGTIYLQDWMKFDGFELIDELRESQANITFKLCKRFINEYPQILVNAREQIGTESFYSRRCEIDSALDSKQTLESQFNLLRSVDPKRYPAFFDLNGHRYYLQIHKG